MLHGYGQDASIIHKTLRNMFNVRELAGMDIMTPNAPLSVIKDDMQVYGWFPLQKIDLKNGMCLVTWEDYELVLRHMELFKGHYDVVIGFSQGCLAALLLACSSYITVDRMLLFSPIVGTADVLRVLPNTDVMVFVGDRDDLVLPQHSVDYITQIKAKTLVIEHHKGGHYVPTTAESKRRYKEFVST